MAPVLKTGKAQAFVGSNPTPSASFFLHWALDVKRWGFGVFFFRLRFLRRVSRLSSGSLHPKCWSLALPRSRQLP